MHFFLEQIFISFKFVVPGDDEGWEGLWSDIRRSLNVSSVAEQRKSSHVVVVVVVVGDVDADVDEDEAGCSHWSQPLASQSRGA